jgi:hypothetical protein
MEVNGIIQVRWDTLPLESGVETGSKVIEIHGLIRMTRGAECKCSSIEANGLI